MKSIDLLCTSPKVKKLLEFMSNLKTGLPFLRSFNDLIPYVINRENRIVMDSFIRNILHGIELDQRKNFQQQYEELRRRYEKIVVDVYYMRQIGEMCVTYYIWRMECKKNEKILYVMIPVLPDYSYDKIINHYFFDVLQSEMVIITPSNYKFWHWMFQYHINEIEFSTRYTWKEMRKREMHRINNNDNGWQVALNSDEQEILKQMNIGNEFVCFANRDNAYLSLIKGKEFDANAYGENERNSPLEDYNLLAREYYKMGIPLVRMGAKVEQRTDIDGIIDYASDYRTEKLDFYLISKCRFFVTNNSGIRTIAGLFNTPTVMVNTPILSFGEDLTMPMSPERNLVIMKKFWYQQQNRYLSLDEILYLEGKNPGNARFKVYQVMGIVLHNNSQEEILDIAEEMRGRLEGTFVYTMEDEKLQERYRNILERNIKKYGNHYFTGRYSAKFLRQNSWFLENVDKKMSIKNLVS